jgi:hypothetical protein
MLKIILVSSLILNVAKLFIYQLNIDFALREEYPNMLLFVPGNFRTLSITSLIIAFHPLFKSKFGFYTMGYKTRV